MGGSAAHSNSSELERLLLRTSRKDEAALKTLHTATNRKLLSIYSFPPWATAALLTPSRRTIVRQNGRISP
jgi:hypothetical protein